MLGHRLARGCGGTPVVKIDGMKKRGEGGLVTRLGEADPEMRLRHPAYIRPSKSSK